MKGVNLSLVSLANLFVAFTSNILLAHLLNPEDFGIFFLISSSLGAIYSLLGLNLHFNVICEKEISQEYWKTIVFLVYVIGIIEVFLAILFFLAYGNIRSIEHALWYVLLVSVGSFVTTLSAVVVALDERSLKYNRVAFYELISNNVPHVVAMCLALILPGAWILFGREILKGFIRLVIALWIIRPTLKPSFNRKDFHKIFSYTKYVYIARLFTGLYHKIDKWFVGHFFGTVELGFYSLAYRLAFLLHQILAPIMFRFFLGVFAETERKGRNQELVIHYSSLLLIGLIAFSYVLSAVMYFEGKKIVSFVYGRKWESMYYYFVALIPIFVFQTAFDHLRSFFFSTGKPKVILYSQIVSVFGILIGLLVIFYYNPSSIGIGIVWSVGILLKFVTLLFSVPYPVRIKAFIFILTFCGGIFWVLAIAHF